MIEPASLRALPKAELHQHLDGALLPETAVELAEESGIGLTLEEARARLVAPNRCRDQAELLEYFDLPVGLLQSASALGRCAEDLVRQMADDGVTYGEIRWAPRLHLRRGLSVSEVIDAVASGVATGTEPARAGGGGLLVTLIVTAMRSHPPADNAELAHAAVEFGPPVVGFDLAGPEAAFPATPHAPAFEIAERGGLATTAHAGEVPGTDRMLEALALGVQRIAHGVTVGADPALAARVREIDVTLDMCPTSNVQAGIVADIARHPFAALHRAGVSVTLSTDDRTVAATTLTEELARCAEAGRLAPGELAAIAINGFRRAFGPRDLVAPREAAARVAWTAWAASVTR